MSLCLFHRKEDSGPDDPCTMCDGENKSGGMRIDDLVNLLRKIYDDHGNIEVRWRSLAHTFIPEPDVRDDGPLVDGGSKFWLLLNP